VPNPHEFNSELAIDRYAAAIMIDGFSTLHEQLRRILEQLHRMENKMSDLATELGVEQEAIDALAARIDNISGPLQAALDAANAALAAAQAADAADQATIADLQSQAADALATVQTHVDELNALAAPPA
jgi:chromosome segregation ATPase